MDLKRIAKDTAKTLISYLTYQAVRTVAAQLRETNPPLSMWFHRFSSTAPIQDGEAYLRALMQENQDLAFRVMTVRSHLVEEIADYMPEMARSGVQQANMEHRRSYLERITSLELSDDAATFEQLTPGEEFRSEIGIDSRGDRQPDSVTETSSDSDANMSEGPDALSDTDKDSETAES